MQVVELTKNSEFKLNYRGNPDIIANHCLIDIKACGVCSTDIYRSHDNGAYHYPLVMGHEIAGIIEKVGSEVNEFCKGDKVSIFPLLPCFKCSQCNHKNYPLCEKYLYFGSRCDGGYSEKLLVPSWNLLKISKNIDLKDAWFYGTYSSSCPRFKNIRFTKKKR